MCSGCSAVLLLALASLAGATDLRVCADPDNLPYSNSHGQGFENELARLVGRQLNRHVRYYWLPQRGKYFGALRAGACDMAMEAPLNYPGIRTTKPYYRSIYVFLSRRDRNLNIRSFNDALLRNLRIGVQVMGDDDAVAPPAEALAARGMLRNITWYGLYRNYLTANRPAVLIDAIEKGEIDVAIAWGPLGGYFARIAQTPLRVTPVSPRSERSVRFAFDIAMAVEPRNVTLAGQLNGFLARHAVETRRILERYGVPLLDVDR